MPPRRKRCRVIESSFESVDTSSDSDHEGRFSVHPSPQKFSESNHQWLDKYAPKNAFEICINPTKLKQVKDSLQKMMRKQSSTKLLVLAGPCGSSKSTTVKVLAREMISDGDIFNDEDQVIEYQESERISIFLQSCKYKTNSVILIEELPNVYHQETLMEFREALRHWIYSENTFAPLVLCLSEFEYEGNDKDNERARYSLENNMTVETLLSQEIFKSSKVEVIKFNSLAPRFLNKTIRPILKREGMVGLLNDRSFETYLADLYKVGDIRSIISNLEMWARFHKETSKVYARENSLSIFHALGKIIFSSKEFEGESGNMVNSNSIAKVIESYPEKNTALLNLGLLENYHIFRNSQFSLSVASSICNDLSISDICPIGEIGARSTRVNLSKAEKASKDGATSKLKMKFPRHFKMLRMRSNIYNQVDQYRKYLSPESSFQTLNLIDGYYLPLILNKRGKTHRLRYNRLGGKFQELYADENFVAEERTTLYAYDQFQNDIDTAIEEQARGRNNVDFDNDLDDENISSDPIEDSSQTNADFSQSSSSSSDAGFSDDDEIDLLISQGKL
ncbi:rad17 [Candida oxycetoniae]|uniref:Rad17 n=1 Tax=Candida oxycetoniae TaxID=497107 RepID=A0AAI9WXS6_9ASCO|nr:rad17 [Candida oxycetoniae]KAI3404622.2 rad17 [Candida oxycetoniae]